MGRAPEVEAVSVDARGWGLGGGGPCGCWWPAGWGSKQPEAEDGAGEEQ